MPIVHECAAPDCPVLTMGRYCLDHELEYEGADLDDILAAETPVLSLAAADDTSR